MKKLYSLLIIFTIIISTFVYLYLIPYFEDISTYYGIQTLSTDKKKYSIGEKVEIYWSDFKIKECTGMIKDFEIFKQEKTGWEKVPYKIPIESGDSCINGQFFSGSFRGDVITCSFSIKNSKSGNFSWNSEIYEKKGFVDSCLKYIANQTIIINKTINKTMLSYDLKNASSGKYKIKFGKAQKIIEII